MSTSILGAARLYPEAATNVLQLGCSDYSYFVAWVRVTLFSNGTELLMQDVPIKKSKLTTTTVIPFL